MKRLVELKEAFTRGQMSEREYLSQSNALISSSTGPSPFLSQLLNIYYS